MMDAGIAGGEAAFRTKMGSIDLGEEEAACAAPTQWRPRTHGFLAFDNEFFRSGDAVQGVAVLVVPKALDSATSLALRWRATEGAAGGPPLVVAQASQRLWERGREDVDGHTGVVHGDTIAAGTATFPFSWRFPTGLPRSFEQESAMAMGKILLGKVGGGGGSRGSTQASFGSSDGDRDSFGPGDDEEAAAAAAAAAATGGGGGTPKKASSSSSGGKPKGMFVRYVAELVLEGVGADRDAAHILARKAMLVYEQQPPPAVLEMPLEMSGSKTFLMGKGRVLSMTARLAGGQVLTPGAAFSLAVQVSNQSKRAVSTIRVFLIAELGGPKRRRVLNENLREQDSCWAADLQLGAAAGSEPVEECTALTLPKSDGGGGGCHGSVTRSGTASLSHTLVVEAVVPNAMNLQVRVPVVVVERSREPDETQHDEDIFGAGAQRDGDAPPPPPPTTPGFCSPYLDGNHVSADFDDDDCEL